MLAQLRKNLISYFDEEELRTLCSDLGVDYDSLRGEGKAAKARELVTYCERRGCIPKLLRKCIELRPNASWSMPNVTREIPSSQGTPQFHIFSEDGSVIADDKAVYPPLPEFDPAMLEVPGGAVKLCDRFYIEREADGRLKEQMVKWGTTTTIRAPRQTGKTSLLARGIQHAREQGINVVLLDFQGCGSDQLASLSVFLRGIAESICDELDLDEQAVEKAWQGSRSAPIKLRRFIEKQVLPVLNKPLVLAMDEADCLLQTDFHKDFFGLLRSWHNLRASCQDWNKFNIVLVISTEPYLLIDDVHQSPFNVGLDLGLNDFDEAQVRDLNQRHGSPVAAGDLPYLMTLLCGHPYLTRRTLYAMVAEHIAWSELVRNASTDHGPFSDHLRHQYWGIRDKPELEKALKEIISTNCCSDEMALFRLLRAGLVRGSGNYCTCRCGLYELYFRDKLL